MPSAKKIGREATASLEKTLSEIKTPLPDMKDDGAELKAAVAPKKAPTFAEAFKAARAEKGAGKTFTWGGKSYSTNMAGEGAKPAVATRRASATSAGATSRASTPSASTAKAEDKPKVNVDNRFVSRSGSAPLRAKVEEKPDTSRADAKKRVQNYASRMQREAVRKRAEENAPTGRNVGAKLANALGFGSENAARQARYIRQREAFQSANKPLLLTGEEARKANKGTIGGYAKGGKIDGCAVRGKTRAMRKK